MTKLALSHFILFLFAYDSLMWSAYLFRHSQWLKTHPSALGYCDRLSYNMLATASIMTGIFLTGVSLMWLWYKSMYGYNGYCFGIIISIHISTIHLFALLAHCTSLDDTYWPPISKCMARYVVRPIKNKLSH